MSSLFKDINGKAILPGATVVVARHNNRWNKRIVLTKGVVYRTQVRFDKFSGRPYGGTVGLIIDTYPQLAKAGDEVKAVKVKRTFRNLDAVMVVE